MGEQQLLDVGCWLRRAEQIALHLRTTERAQHFALLLGLDAFGRRRHAARGGDIDDRLDDAGRALRLADIGDEAAVDLDLVEREALQIAQRGIAGAEIVERNADPDGAQLVQHRERRIVVADQHRLGDLELEPACGQTRGRQRCDDLQRQRAALELHRRDVDREADIVRPGRGLDAGRGQHPLAELVDQAGLLGDRDEFGRRDHAALRMAPAQQRLAAGDPVVLQVEAGLIINLEAAVDDGLAQVHLQDAAGADLGVHVGLEEAMGAAAGGLGGVHRQIGIFQDLVEVGTILRRQRNADRGIRGDLMAEAFIGRADRLIDAVDELGDVVRAFDGGLDDGEFVAAEPGHEIGLAHAAAQADGDGLQQFVADHVSERVVDALEFVDVDVEHGKLPVRRDAGQFVLELFVEQRAVRQVGQRVVMGEVGDALLGRRRSVMSSWVATHPPSASGSLTTWTERPSGVVMTIALR